MNHIENIQQQQPEHQLPVRYVETRGASDGDGVSSITMRLPEKQTKQKRAETSACKRMWRKFKKGFTPTLSQVKEHRSTPKDNEAGRYSEKTLPTCVLQDHEQGNSVSDLQWSMSSASESLAGLDLLEASCHLVERR